MTVSLNEVANLVCQLAALKDDSNDQIIDVTVDLRGARVQLDSELFLSEFVSYDVLEIYGQTYDFQLVIELDGVVFSTLLTAKQVVDLKESMPEQWEYIQWQVMSRERLEAIKEHHQGMYKNGFTALGISEDDIDFLIEQAERAQELGVACESWQKRHDALKQQNKRYREIFKRISHIKNDEDFNPYAYMILEIIEWAEDALEGESY